MMIWMGVYADNEPPAEDGDWLLRIRFESQGSDVRATGDQPNRSKLPRSDESNAISRGFAGVARIMDAQSESDPDMRMSLPLYAWCRVLARTDDADDVPFDPDCLFLFGVSVDDFKVRTFTPDLREDCEYARGVAYVARTFRTMFLRIADFVSGDFSAGGWLALRTADELPDDWRDAVAVASMRDDRVLYDAKDRGRDCRGTVKALQWAVNGIERIADIPLNGIVADVPFIRLDYMMDKPADDDPTVLFRMQLRGSGLWHVEHGAGIRSDADRRAGIVALRLIVSQFEQLDGSGKDGVEL